MALALVVVHFVVPVVLRFVAPALLEVPYGIAVGVTIWGLAWLFAISGVRRGRGGANVAAWVSLAALVFQAGAMLIIAYH